MLVKHLQEMTVKRLVVPLFLIGAVPLFGRNMSYTHGHDYTYNDPSGNGVTFFPVAWDLRGTFYLLRDYYRHYRGCDQEQAEAMAGLFMDSILVEAEQAGVNTLIIRTEPLLLNREYTTGRADQARDLGLNVILGGMKCGGGTLDEAGHNAAVLSIWQDYREAFGGTRKPGDFCGVFAHDEPDNHDYEYYDEVALTARLLHSGRVIPGSIALDLPLGAALAQFSTSGDLSLNPAYLRNHTYYEIDPDNWRSTPYVYGHQLDFISMNYYPTRVRWDLQTLQYPDPGSTDDGTTVIRGAADLVPSQGTFRDAYCNRDEYYELSGNGVLRVYTIEGGDVLGRSGFQFHGQYDLQLDLQNNDYRVASSDTRSADTGSRPGVPVLNGGLVFWVKDEPIGMARAVYWHENGIRTRQFPSAGSYDSRVFCVGETDYRSGWNSQTECTGVIGSDEMRILWAGSPQQAQPVDAPWIVKVFARDASGNLVACTTDQGSGTITLPAGFHPIGAVWGYFWKKSSDFQHLRSGFVLYTADGQYMVIRTPAMSAESWGATSTTPYTGLWGQGMTAGPVTVYRDCWNPPSERLVRNFDRLVALVSPAGSSQETALVWTDASISIGDLGPISTMSSNEVLGDGYPVPRAENLSSLCVRDYGAERSVMLFVNDDTPSASRRMRRTANILFPFIQDYEVHFLPGWENSWETLCAYRPRHNRIFGPDVLVDKSDGSLYLWGGQSDTTLPDTLVGNMFADAFFSAQDMGVLDIMLEYGVNQPSTAGCLFLTVQCQGRGGFGFGQYFPGDGVTGYDELMYIMGASLVHGVRGFNLFGLDMSLYGGPTNPLPSLNRFPPELLLWGASVDGPDDVDMVTRTHQAVHAFTCVEEGVGDYIDLLDALVDPSYQVLGGSEACNAYMDPQHQTIAVPYEEEPCFNFLALREPDDDILVLVSNDGPGWITADCIVFPDPPRDSYINHGTPDVLIGSVPGIVGSYCLKNTPPGYYLMFPDGFDKQGFALIRIPFSGD